MNGIMRLVIVAAVISTAHCQKNDIVDQSPYAFNLSGRVIFSLEGDGVMRANGIWALELNGATGSIRMIAGGGSDCRVSNDGNLITYTKLSTQQSHDIYLVGGQGSLDFNLTNRSTVSEFYPDVSSIRNQVIFSALNPATGATSMNIVNIDGSGLHALTDTIASTATRWLPRWSPDARNMAYIKRTQPPPSDKYALCVLDADGLAEREFVETGNLIPPVWAPDGVHLSYESASTAPHGLGIVDISTGATRELSLAGFTIYPNNSIWTPGGALFCIGRAVNDSLVDVFKLPTSASGNLTRFVTRLRNISALVCSPDGKTIGVIGTANGSDLSFFAMLDDGTEFTRLIPLGTRGFVQVGGFAQWVPQ